MLFRSVLFNVAFYLNFLVQAVIFSPVLLLPERMFWPIGRFWVASTLWLHRTITGIDDEIRGIENIPRGGFIVASKHQSAWETLRLIELFPAPELHPEAAAPLVAALRLVHVEGAHDPGRPRQRLRRDRGDDGARPPRHRRGPADHHLSRKARAGRRSRRRSTATA